MFSLQVLFVILSLSSALRLGFQQYEKLWKEFKIKFKKNYSEEEDEFRKYIWIKTIDMIDSHNVEADLNLHSYTLEANNFSDWTFEEKRRLRGLTKPLIENPDKDIFHVNKIPTLPHHVDWRDKGYVTPVKDQGTICGSCWSFSSTGALEGQAKAKTGVLVSLSEQNLLDCTWKLGNEGCGGGLMEIAFNYVIENNGIDTEKSYPYTGKNGRCGFNASNIGATCKSHIKILKASESNLKSAVATVGPISVCIDASTNKFTFYKKGVFSDITCSSTVLDHAVLVVGYGTTDNRDYWIVKNCWGAAWGLGGYIWMSRNAGNQCGIATSAIYPVM